MLKKKSLPALPDLNKGFLKRVESLASEGSALAMSYADLSERMLKFAQNIRRLSDQAKELDSDKGGEVHQKHLQQVLLTTLGVEKGPVVSKWLSIGEQAEVLLPLKDSVPPQRESLYELAKASKKITLNKKWFRDEDITVNSTVREVLKAVKGKRRTRQKREKEFNASVTISFRDYSDAFSSLKPLIDSGAECKVKAGEAFWAALESDIRDEKAFDEIKKRLS